MVTSVDVVPGVPQAIILELLLFLLYISELFHIVGNYTVGYANNTTIHATIPRPLSHPQVMESLNQDLAAIDCWCLKWHMRLYSKKTKSMVVNRPRTHVPVYGDLTLGVAKLDEAKSLRVLGITLDSKSTFETHLREVVPKAARSLGIVCGLE